MSAYTLSGHHRFGHTSRHRTACQVEVECLESRRLLSSTWYVATTGSDAANGQLATPWKTLQHAADTAVSGDTILIRGGTYTENLTIRTANLTLASYTGEKASITSSNTSASSLITVDIDLDANHTTLQNLDISGGYYYAVKTETDWDTATVNRHGPANLLITGCTIHDSGSDLVKLTPATTFTTVTDSELYHSGIRISDNATGIDGVQANDTTIRNCFIHDISETAICLKGGSFRTLIEGNRIARTGYSGILLGQQTDTEYFDTKANANYYESIDGVVRNNVITDAKGAGIGAWAAQRPQIYNNTLWNVAQTSFGGLLIQAQSHYTTKDVLTSSADVAMYNNIVVTMGTRPSLEIRDSGYTGTLTLKNNLYYRPGDSVLIRDLTRSFYGSLAQWQAKGLDAGSLEINPQLDVANGLALRAWSPAIDAGAASPATTDILGHARPMGAACDIGAYEYLGTKTADPNPHVWTNTAITPQTGSFTLEFDATPMQNNMEMAIGLSNGSATGYSDLAANIRFSTRGAIEVRGYSYDAYASVPYAAYSKYHFKFVVNLSNSRYDVYVTAPGQAATPIALGFPLRWEQFGVKTLSSVASYAEAGSALVSSPAITTTVKPVLTNWNNINLAAQTGTFTLQFDATPLQTSREVLLGLSGAAAHALSDLAVAFRFSSANRIQAYDLNTWKSRTSISYAANTAYHFRVTVDIAMGTYSAWVSAGGANAVQLASNYHFQSTVKTLSNLGTYVGNGTVKITNPLLS